MIVGIPIEQKVAFPAVPARCKGTTIKFSRRMNPTYPAAIALATSGRVGLDAPVTHRFPLAQAAEAFAQAADYVEGVGRVIINPSRK